MSALVYLASGSHVLFRPPGVVVACGVFSMREQMETLVDSSVGSSGISEAFPMSTSSSERVGGWLMVGLVVEAGVWTEGSCGLVASMLAGVTLGVVCGPEWGVGEDSREGESSLGKFGSGREGRVGLGSDGRYAAFPMVAATGILMVSIKAGVSLVGVEGAGSFWSDSFWHFFLFFMASAVEAGPLVRLV